MKINDTFIEIVIAIILECVVFLFIGGLTSLTKQKCCRQMTKQERKN